MGSPWHFGNTTVRNPLRIKDGLTVLSNSTLNGNLIGTYQESQFALELDRAGVINMSTNPDFFGRKWRACFSQLGFITHKFKKNINPSEVDPVVLEIARNNKDLGLSGRPYELTPSGLRMINAQTVQEQQECMLRALLAYEIPSNIEPKNGDMPFKPFIFILQVLEKLSTLPNPLGLSKVEMGIVQSYRDHSKVDEVVEMILKYRQERNVVVGRVEKRKVEKELLNKLGELGGVKSSSISDYADVNFRYPRLTGIVSFKKKRLVLSEEKMPVIESILKVEPNIIGSTTDNEYLVKLWNGSDLPTDNELIAKNEITRLRGLLLYAGVDDFFIPKLPDTYDIALLNQIRIRLEVLYQQVLEENFAEVQKDSYQISEIIAYLKKLDKQPLDQSFDIDIDDEPAYFEWAVWRAFLAINQSVNKPHEARRFKVDQDFYPLGCAPGGGPDLIFEFEDYVLVVEVTLTSSSRQEATEGEPVRRHVAREKAKVAVSSGKPVYGLFMARTIDNNTAETFRIGVWYNGDEPEFINIVPLTLKQFIIIMEKFLSERFTNKEIRRVLDNCLISRNAHAPAWKKEIEHIVESFIN